MSNYDEVKNNQVTITLTLEQLALVTEGLQSSIASLEERVRQGGESQFDDPYLEAFQKELAESRSVWEKLDAIWWTETKADEKF
jgi:hypothetical protein